MRALAHDLRACLLLRRWRSDCCSPLMRREELPELRVALRPKVGRCSMAMAV